MAGLVTACPRFRLPWLFPFSSWEGEWPGGSGSGCRWLVWLAGWWAGSVLARGHLAVGGCHSSYPAQVQLGFSHARS
eukprot:11921191-Alexandrium_andersonii.AAC.1